MSNIHEKESQSRRAPPPLAGWAALWALYLLVLGQSEPWDLVIGALVAAVVLWGCRRALPLGSSAGRTGWGARIWAIPRVLGMVLAAIPSSIPALARLILGQGPRRAGMVTVATATWDCSPSPNGLAVLGWLAMMIPGSLLAEIDSAKGTLTFHLADKDNAPVFADRLRRMYAAQRKVLP